MAAWARITHHAPYTGLAVGQLSALLGQLGWKLVFTAIAMIVSEERHWVRYENNIEKS